MVQAVLFLPFILFLPCRPPPLTRIPATRKQIRKAGATSSVFWWP